MVSELFEQRWGLYSDRFKSTMLFDLVKFDWSVVLMQPDDKWKQHRSILHQYLNKPVIVQYQGTIERLSRTLLFHLHRTPEEFAAYSRHIIGAMVMEITYGIKTSLNNDPYVELAERALESFTQVSAPGAHLVDIIPILKYIPSWVPGAGFQKKAKTLREEFNAMITIPFAVVKPAIKAGNAPPSIVGTALGEINPESPHVTEEEITIRDIAGNIYMAAIDTTESALQMVFMAMLLYPDVQRKAQAELDTFLGTDKLPSLDDRKHLPYIEALIKETLRWHPVTPVGFPHLLKEDDIIGEYCVPKGTLVLGNAWSLLHSKSVYGDDAEEFNPDRFMNPQTKYPDSAFGFGRRICPGRHMADSILFILITNILYTFDIIPYKTSTGIELPSLDAFVPGIVSRPLPFQCQFIPRSSRTKAFLEQLSGLK
ncbi:hypothetical protein Clacol_000342 [Clathrus columnatus]|uniref:Cytochrome P450 n=1 Tax=Clathrus columnatus TaxID=1419009 RepID=A0AAV4ZYC1_9AGAM|nr:hypothetical protein Clacol_000342 [Clathrus columnatus]